MKYLSLFSGIGGFENGIQRAFNKLSTEVIKDRQRGNGDINQVESDVLSASRTTPLCIGYSEIDPYADAIYKYNFGGTNERRSFENEEQQLQGTGDKEGQCGELNNKRTIGQHSGGNLGDCTKINPKELPDFDLLVGGFPCQAFSIAGKRRGFDDTRGTLIYDVMRILKEKQPRHFILENVKGLLSHDGGRTFKVIISSLVELGYGVEWQILNAKNFGVPQNRERVFIVGHLGGFGGRQIFPIRAGSEKNDLQIEILGHKDCYRRSNQIFNPDGIIETLSTCGGGGQHPCTLAYHNNRTTVTKIDDSNSLTSSFRGHPDGDGRPEVFDGAKIRRLTPTECERLMGYPDDWTKYGLYDEVKEMSDTRRYKACGNGVVSNVVEEVVKRLFEVESLGKEE